VTGGARWWLYGAALATGGAFSILFTGETYRGGDGGFGDLSVVAIIAGNRAFLPLLLAAAVAMVVGSAGRWRFLLVVPATLVYTIVAVYGTDLFPYLFSVSGWREIFGVLGSDVYEAANIMYAEPIPYGLAPGLLLILVPVVMILVAFATSATLYERSPIISLAILGLTIGVLSTISFEDGAGLSFAVFLACSVGLLLSLDRAGPEAPGRPAVVAGAVVVALVLLVPKLPFSDEMVSPGMIDWTRIGTGGTSRLDVQADVGDYLTAGRDAELMRVQSSEPLLWRGGTMDYFDGVRWSDTTQPGADDGEEIAAGVETRPVLQRVQVLNARTDIVFGGYKIVRTSESLGSATQNSDGSWSMATPFEGGDSYEVLSEIPQPTVAQLRNAGTDYPPAVVQRFLQFPSDTPPVVDETADKILRKYDPKTPYDEARAIEQYLTYDGGFTYNLDVSYRRADKAIEEFLGDGKEGFCTQFSTSMALLLRDMDVPSRVVYGATTGENVGSGEYLVRGSNMHTWVEAYFPGVGWYPFNPTPGFSMPTAMEANAPRPELPLGGQSGQSENNNLDQRRSERERGQQTPQEKDPNHAARGPATNRFGENSIPVWPLFVLLPVLLVATVPISKRALLARGRPEDLYQDLAGRLRDVLLPGKNSVADSPALTPTERVLLLAGAAGVEEAPTARFALAYSEHLYSSIGENGERVASAYRDAIQGYGRLPRWRRALGAVNPASLLVRSRKYVSARRAQLAKTLRGRLRRDTRERR
jgi:transglutaminase-like putative cysteine protease